MQCVHAHELRSVCNIARDLSSLQSVCKSSQSCAAAVWPAVVECCSHIESVKAVAGCTIEELRKRLPSDQYPQETLDKALQLPPEKLAIFIQMQCEQDYFYYGTQAAERFRLSSKDLKSVKHQLIRNPRNRSAPARRYCRQVSYSSSIVCCTACKICSICSFLFLNLERGSKHRDSLQHYLQSLIALATYRTR